MARPSATPVPRVVEFHRTKYGRELLVDAAFVRDMPTFRPGVSVPHILTFHDILLVTRGRGRFSLDGRHHRVGPGSVLFSAPGEVRRLEVPGVDGACLFFAEEFVAEAFSDVRFLDRFAFFRPARSAAVLVLGASERRAFLQHFARMRREIAALRADATHALRAVLYEVLVLLNRAYVARLGDASPPEGPRPVETFRALVERDFPRRHRVADYAAELGLTPGHLSALCRHHLRRSAGAWIRARIALEAKRLLAYGRLPAAEVGERLGFEDSAYFSRFFRREAGLSPSRFRESRGFQDSVAPPRTARNSPSSRS